MASRCGDPNEVALASESGTVMETGRLLRRVFWGCVIVLIDLRFGRFDVLVDSIGYLMIAVAAADLIRVDGVFRRVNLVANFLALLGLRQFVSLFDPSSSSADNAIGTAAGGPSVLLGWSSSPGEFDAGVIVSLFLETVAGISGLFLVWYLLSGVMAVATAAQRPGLAARAAWARRWSVVVLGVGQVVGLVSWMVADRVPSQPAPVPLLLVVTAMALAVGLIALKVLWDTGSASIGPVPTIVAPRPMTSAGRALVVALAVATVGGLLYSAGSRPAPLSPQVTAASTITEDLLVGPGAVAIDQGSADGAEMSFPYDPAGGSQCVPIDQMVGIDSVSGNVIWRREVPRRLIPGISVLDDLVLAVDQTVDRMLPSVAAIDSVTGEVRWQRYLAADTIHIYGTNATLPPPGSSGDGDDGHGGETWEPVVAVALQQSNSQKIKGVLLDNTGAIVGELDDDMLSLDRTPGRIQSGLMLANQPDPYFVFMSYAQWSDDHSWATMASPQVNNNGVQAVVDRRYGNHDLYLVRPDGGALTKADSYPVTSLYNRYGNAASPGAPVQIGDEQALIVQGSDQGPDSRMNVFDIESGAVVWTRDGIRSAAMAGPNVVYDVRNQATYSEVVTRSLHLAAGDDGDREYWSTDLAVNPAGGNGYLGSVDEGLVFLVAESAGADNPEESFLVVPNGPAGPGDVPAVIRAGGLVGGGPGVLSHVDENLFAAIGRNGLVWQRRDGAVQRIDLGVLAEESGSRIGSSTAARPDLWSTAGSPVRAMTVVDDTIVLETAGPVDCDRFDASSSSSTTTKLVGLAQPDEPVINQPVAGNECQPGPADMTAVDLETGRILWTRTIPAQTSGLARLSDSVLMVDPQEGELTPSVTAFDPVDGSVRWQRHVEAGALHLLATATTNAAEPDRVAVVRRERPGSYREPGRLVTVLDSNGEVVNEFASNLLGYSPVSSGSMPGWTHRTLADGWMGLTASPPTNQARQAVITGQSVGVKADLVTTDADQPEPTVALRFTADGDFHRLGNDSSPGSPLQVGDGYVFVLFGSAGADNRAEVLDTESKSGRAQPAWSLEGIRSMAAAGDRILYDRRNDEPVDAVSTRELFLIESDDPEAVVWSTALAVNDAGGNGYLGMVGDDLVFLVEGSGGSEPRFLLVDGSAASASAAGVPDLLEAAGVLGGGPSPASLVSDDVLVAGGSGELIWQRTGQVVQRVTFDTTDDVISLVVIDGIAVVERGQAWADHIC